MSLNIFLHCVDASECGRVDYDFLSEQTLMELLIQDVKNISKLQDADGSFLNISEWPGLSFDFDGKVNEIDYDNMPPFDFFGDLGDEGGPIGPGGSIDLRWIPRHVEKLCMHSLDVSGTIRTVNLPRNLRVLEVSKNKFFGPFETVDLPNSAKKIFIWQNQLSGTLDLSCVPPNVKVFSAGSNKFTGSLDLRSLPKGIVNLDVSSNQFAGDVDLSKIPATLITLRMLNYHLRQDKLVICVPKAGVGDFSVWKEHFTEVVDLDGNDLKDKVLF